MAISNKNRKLYLQLENEDLIEISSEIKEFEMTEIDFMLEEDYQAFLDVEKEQVYESLTDEQYEEYVSDWSQFTEEHLKMHEESTRIAKEQAKE